jgi:uncharacterized protein (TIGR04255 family)
MQGGAMSITASDWLDLDVPPREVFERSPLVLALCQVRYSPVLSVSSPMSVAPFQQAIIDRYPVTSEERNVNVQVSGDFSTNQASVQSSLGPVSWRFADTDDTWTVVLTPEFLTLETRSYHDFADFVDRLDYLLRALAKHIGPRVGLRIGLRYVNEVRPDNQDWASVVRPELLGPLFVPALARHTKQAIQHVQLRGPDGVGVNIQHGLFPEGTVINPRPDVTPPSSPFYLFDVDVYQEFRPGVLPVKATVVCDHVRQYHDVVSRLFRWSVTEAYTATLGRRSDGVE